MKQLDRLDRLYKQTLDEAIDNDFNGNSERAAMLYMQAGQYKSQIEKGELYEPRF